MFSKITVENFTAFDNFSFDLVENKTDKKAKKLAIVYGENGIGKTCLVRSIYFLIKTYKSLVTIEEQRLFFDDFVSKEEKLDESYIRFVNNSLENNRISGFLNEYRRLHSEGDMKLTYEIILNKVRFVYSMVFDKASIKQEKLLCNGNILFSCANKRLELTDLFTDDSGFKDMLQRSFDMYFGEKHTFLSCLKSSKKSLSASFLKRVIKKEVSTFLNFLDSIYVKEESEDSLFDVENRLSMDFAYPLVSGNYNERIKKRLDRTQVALSMFYSSLYSNIESLYYKKDILDSGRSLYHLNFVEKTSEGLKEIPFEYESTGTKKLAYLFIGFYEVVKNKKVVVIDEIDNGINDILLRTIFESLDSSINGQLIVTTHNTLLLKNSIKKNIYLLDRDNDNQVCSYSLDEFGRKIQAGTDVIGQYLKGLYGGVPQTGAFSMTYIVEALKDYE